MKTIHLASNELKCDQGYPDQTFLADSPSAIAEQTASLRGWYVPLKAALDWVIALVLLIAAIPIIAVCAAAIALTSPGPVFYCQRRVGKRGREFTLIKLRTMRADAERLTGPVWSVGDDPRITRVGRFLRDTHLDEFPQLVNVLFGQMSLVGPRPERPQFVLQLREEIPFYEERVRLRPGITGLSQMRLPADSDLESVRKKLVHDLYYIRHVSLWLDLRILGYTAGSFLRSILNALFAVFALPAQETVEKDFHPLVHQDFRGLDTFERESETQLDGAKLAFESRYLKVIRSDRVQAPI